MHSVIRLAFLGAALVPATTFAQMPLPEADLVIEEPAIIIQEPGVIVEDPMLAGPLDEESARVIAMMNGMASVEEVDIRMWDGNFEVEGSDVSGNDMEITIDGETGAVLDIDD